MLDADLLEPLPGRTSDVVDQRTMDAETAALMRFGSEAKGFQ